MSSPLFVGVAGGTASGKSTVARKIHESLAGIPAALVDQDSYYKDLSDLSPAERKEVNFDHPDAFDVDLLLAHLRELKAGRPVKKPVYNYGTYSREPSTVIVEPGQLVLLEGILVLHMDSVRELMDVKIFVD